MDSLFFRYASVFNALSMLNVVGLLAVLAVAVSRHSKSRGASGDLGWAVAAGVLLASGYLLFPFIRTMGFPPWGLLVLLPLVKLAFVVAYAFRTMNAPPAAARAYSAPMGAAVATGGAYGPPPAVSHAPRNPPFVQPPQPLASRSIDEMNLFMDLHPCVCGETRFERRSALLSEGSDLVAVYRNPCARCGLAREFKFVVNDPVPPRPDGGMQFGVEPSRILDPGEFAAASDMLAKQLPGSVQGMTPAQRQSAIATLDRAAAALDEAIKFIPPGMDEVPPHLFRSAVGVYERDRLPGQFRRERLEARANTYRGLLAQWRAAG
ncbi:MAG: hypothetical protein R3A52_18655 [Polyangiales bacterium]